VAGVGVGVATIKVRFTHEDIETTITVQLADHDNLTVTTSPFPNFDGSKEGDASLLSTIGGSSPSKFE
jgi:hypothetical protein